MALSFAFGQLLPVIVNPGFQLEILIHARPHIRFIDAKRSYGNRLGQFQFQPRGFYVNRCAPNFLRRAIKNIDGGVTGHRSGSGRRCTDRWQRLNQRLTFDFQDDH